LGRDNKWRYTDIFFYARDNYFRVHGL
jgi:hypothetical protein